MEVDLRAIGASAAYFSAATHAAIQYKAFVEACDKMRDAAGKLDPGGVKEKFSDLDKALALLAPIFGDGESHA